MSEHPTVPPVPFAPFERRLSAFLVALWRLRAPIRPMRPDANGMPPRRLRLTDGLIWVPDSLPGIHADQAAGLYRAALVHAGAHLRFSSPRFPVGTLKPVQVALVSLIEDARVEHLAMREYPGLLQVWRPFHVAEGGGTPNAPGLMARLARALIDPDYDDGDAWVSKGRSLFFDGRAEWETHEFSRRVGGLLGNDLGQMRLSFNPKTHVVEPAYRDDNLGLWESNVPASAEGETAYESLRTEREERDDGRPDDTSLGIEAEERAPVAEAPGCPAGEEEMAAPPALYSEWDYRIARERPNWVRVVERVPGVGDPAEVRNAATRHAAVADRLAALVRAAGVGRPQRLHRQLEGDRLDLDACIEVMVSRCRNEIPDPRIHAALQHRTRDLSALLLLDVSASTGDQVPDGIRPVLEVERDAAALFATALDRIGDRFAIHAFRSNGRNDVSYYRLKDFREAYDDAAMARLASLRPGLSTRLGAALRHGGRLLGRQSSHRRLLLVVTDGEPSDIDVADRRLLVEDTRQAVFSLAAQGIDAFGIGLDPGGRKYLTRMFGVRNSTVVDHVERLADLLPNLFLTLSR
ncbi:hypothetical protein J2848_002538 [Azospirillum lipoferum]|uniref:VWA domain-containing protein n=1 Tax=Azospirillum lipoferum TaxID=193 RepID=A0A5A9GNJ7_AZOLI|nr:MULTISPECIES: VWA domain-containing protein [Azospirillum]KAA0595967.1 VWA domain-containing protein [Azospirillum lipoferum]MCP1610865.1 hypothetical protein [Azospirillum lipoferum]MDW5533987.1 VWA domain-containing protein [Azospirillum sp. NL1]